MSVTESKLWLPVLLNATASPLTGLPFVSVTVAVALEVAFPSAVIDGWSSVTATCFGRPVSEVMTTEGWLLDVAAMLPPGALLEPPPPPRPPPQRPAAAAAAVEAAAAATTTPVGVGEAPEVGSRGAVAAVAPGRDGAVGAVGASATRVAPSRAATRAGARLSRLVGELPLVTRLAQTTVLPRRTAAPPGKSIAHSTSAGAAAAAGATAGYEQPVVAEPERVRQWAHARAAGAHIRSAAAALARLTEVAARAAAATAVEAPAGARPRATDLDRKGLAADQARQVAGHPCPVAAAGTGSPGCGDVHARDSVRHRVALLVAREGEGDPAAAIARQ